MMVFDVVECRESFKRYLLDSKSLFSLQGKLDILKEEVIDRPLYVVEVVLRRARHQPDHILYFFDPWTGLPYKRVIFNKMVKDGKLVQKTKRKRKEYKSHKWRMKT